MVPKVDRGEAEIERWRREEKGGQRWTMQREDEGGVAARTSVVLGRRVLRGPAFRGYPVDARWRRARRARRWVSVSVSVSVSVPASRGEGASVKGLAGLAVEGDSLIARREQAGEDERSAWP
ncbi:hypothetical protein KM043_012233 [Ampulex compressa]|nr:hypothetical protein KM043_012233 [Ampulex compressa]